jgi:hypothetical protein
MASNVYQKNLTQDFLFGGISFTPPSNYYLGLSLTGGSSPTEPSGNNYSRIIIPNTKSYFSYSSSGCLVVSASLAMPQSSGSWGTITDLVLFDAVSSGSARFYTALPSPINVQTNTTLSFSASSITISQT